MVRFTSSSSSKTSSSSSRGGGGGGGALGGLLGGRRNSSSSRGGTGAATTGGSSDDDNDGNGGINHNSSDDEVGPIDDDNFNNEVEEDQGNGANTDDDHEPKEDGDGGEAATAPASAPSKRGIGSFKSNKGPSTSTATSSSTASSSFASTSAFADWAQYVPLRLDSRERHLLTVLEQTLHVSEYTDHVDVAASNTGYMGGGGYSGNSYGSVGFGINAAQRGGGRGGAKARRILDGIMEVCHIAVGLATASGLAVASSAEDEPTINGTSNDAASASSSPAAAPYASKDPADNAALFQSLFEVGRRNKVLNPSSMRTTYGKLMYLLQDAQNPTVAKSLGFKLHKPMLLVGPYLKKHKASHLLQDPRLECAIQYVADRDEHGRKRDRSTLEALVAGKHRVANELVDSYSNSSSTLLRPDDVRRVIESLADAVAYVESNVRPVQSMLRFLQDNFDKTTAQKGYSLALSGSSRSALLPSNSYGRYGYGMSAYASGSNEGPTLSHSHSTQYMFVWQSLSLWIKVMKNMHKLWICADDDLLSTTSTYHLYNTGQGLNRVQNCPKVRSVMSTLLSQTQKEAGAPWVGLSVVHLGDRDVPNALVFIDKYTQIPRFLSPIVRFVHDLPRLCSDPVLANYVNAEFGSPDHLKLTVLADYFKHGFDGSGDDGGSCIDGRLTSSWNWTSRIAKKRYYHAFMLSGFQGFDGDFR